jgi:small subunit ribosomal protein S6
MPSIAITQPYEAVYILDPDLGDERISAITAKYRQIVENGGGTLEKTDVWERRRLAYEIKGRTEGIYVVMQFRSKPAVEAELRRIFQISEDQIRFLIIRRDDDEALLPVAAPAPAAPAAEPTPAAAEAPATVETPEPTETAAPAETTETAEATETVEAPETTEAPEAAAA